MTDDPFLDFIHSQRGELISEMPRASVIISAGCSGTWYFEWFKEKYPHPISRHIGFDLEPAPESLPDGVEYHQRTFCDLSPVEDASIDLVFAGQAIEHIPAAGSAAFFEHAHRVLKPGGWLVMDSPNFTITDSWPYVNPDHVIEYTPKQMDRILKAAGFKPLHSRGLLLCRQNKRVIDNPYDIQGIDTRRILDAKTRPEDSFIWWMEARKAGRPDGRRLNATLKRANEEYEQCLERTAKLRLAQSKGPIRKGPVEVPSLTGRVRAVVRRLTPRRARWLAKVTVKRLAGLYYRDQMRVLTDIRDHVGNLHATTSAISARLDTQDELLALVLQRLRHADELLSASRSIRESSEAQQSLRDDLMSRASDLDRVIRQMAPSAAATNVFWAISNQDSEAGELVMTRAESDFYVAFQNRHRGSEEMIRERQRDRVPSFAGCRRVLDIGCGRGEFLELLHESGIEAEGIDLSSSSLDRCEEKGLKVTRAEATEFLAGMPALTFDGIHMSHVLEHMPFSSAVELLEACADHLGPGAVLVAETPNPHCPEALQAFFLDPTHVRPLFPEALMVLFESLEFGDVQSRFLNPLGRAASGSAALPHDYADYLVVGVKVSPGSNRHQEQREPGHSESFRPASA